MRLRFASILLLFAFAAQGQTAAPSLEDLQYAMHLVGNGEVAALVNRERATGRVSFHFVLNRGEVIVRGFNVVFFGVSQKPIAGGAPVADPLGMLGFAVTQEEQQVLRYDPQSRRISGTLRLDGDASFLGLLARPQGDGKDDFVRTPTLPASVKIELPIDVGKPFAEPRDVVTTIDFRISTRETRVEQFVVPPIDVHLLDLPRISVDQGSIFWYEVARELCVQPVRLLRFKNFPWSLQFQLSGAGLPFGQPGVKTQWDKANVVFDYREWKTVRVVDWWVIDQSELEGLRSKVEDDDCIEVFFVHNFDLEGRFGGGITLGQSGSSQIITTDANARHGIDLTHLAHELGHVLGVDHPLTGPTAGSEGTLMCGSGFRRDNPTINSQQNANLVSNPLLIYTVKFITPGPDCTDSSDCGACR